MKRQFELKKVYDDNDADFIQKSIEIAYQKSEIGEFKAKVIANNNMILKIICDDCYNYALNENLTFGISSQNIQNYLNNFVSKFTKQKYIVTEII